MAHDQFYVFVALLLGQVYYDETILAFYRQHSQNATGNVVVHSPLASLRQKFLDRTEQYKEITFLARNRLQLLKMLSSDADLTGKFPDAQHEFAEATLLYESFLKCTTRRLQLYSSESVATKISVLTKSLISGDYKLSLKSHWGFTIGGALRDVTTLFI